MDTFRVALLQLTPHGFDQQANMEIGVEACRKAKSMGADVALFPEMWNIGYQFFKPGDDGSLQEWRKQAVGQDSRFVQVFAGLAAELDMAIAITYLEQFPDKPRNSVSLFDRHGELALHYAKVHTCEFDVEGELTPGEDFPVVELELQDGKVKVGCMICYDREFPESARILMLHGAEVILTPNACPVERHRLAQFQARATENMLGVAMSNYPRPVLNGNSCAYSPVCFGENGESLDNCLVRAGEDEGIWLAEFDLPAIRKWRNVEAWGNTFRRPRLYSALMDEHVQEPFKREQATR